MSQNMRSGGALVGSGRPLQADQALQPLEGEFNPPSQAIEGENVSGCEVFRFERGDQDDPIGCVESLLRELMTAALCVPVRLATRGGNSLRRLPDRDQTHGEQFAALAFDPDRPVDQPASRYLTQLGDKIEHIAFAIEPAGALPAGPDHNV